MRRVLSKLSRLLLRAKLYFSHADSGVERRNVGLGQFVLLLTLTPFIFSLTLYDFGSAQNVASRYLINPDRFDGQSLRDLTIPPVALPESLRKRLSELRAPVEALCKIRSSRRTHLRGSSLAYQEKWWVRHQLNKELSFKKFRRACDKFNRAKVCTTHKCDKPSPPEIEIVETSQSHFLIFKKPVTPKSDIGELLVASNEGPSPPSTNEKSNGALDGIFLQKVTSASAFQLITYPLWVLGFLLIFPVLAVCIKRRAWGLIVFGLSAASINYVLHVFNIMFSATALEFFHSPLFAQAALAWFLLRGHFFSRPFAVFIALLVFSTFTPLVFNGLSLLDPSYVSHQGYSVLKAQLPIIIFVVVVAIGRLLVVGAKENTALLKKLGLSNTLIHAVHALVLWIPMALLCIPFFYLTEILLPRNITNELHENSVLQFDYSHEKGFLDNALQSTAHATDDVNFIWNLFIEQRKSALSDANDSLQKTDFVQSLSMHYDNVIPPSLEFDEPNSGVFLIGWAVDIATEQTQDSINTAYVKLKDGVKAKLITLVGEQQDKIKQFSDKQEGQANAELNKLKARGKKIILANNTAVQSSIWWGVNYIHAAHQLALLMFAFICFKSFMYVFARVSFNQETGTVVTLGASDASAESSSNSTIRATGLEYTINASNEETFYITRRYQCRGKPPKLTVPQFIRAPFARLFNKAYTMNQIVMREGDADVSCTATKGVEFFEWQLAEDETVVFDFHNFVGMSKELKISTLISPRISSLLLGKMIYSQAKGPGKLVLMAKGRAEICDTSNKVGSLPPERMIAMMLDTKLHIVSELDILNIYLSTAHIQPISGRMIIDVDSQRGSKVGLGSFVKHFIFPG